MKILDYGFIPKKSPKVWEDVMINNSFTKEEFKIIQNYWIDYVGNLEYDLEEEREKIITFQRDRSKTVSPLWSKWAADHSVKVKIDFDYSSTLKDQRENCRDKQQTLSDSEEKAFPGALMCCDTPSRTLGFLFSTFSKLHGLNFGEQNLLLPKISKYSFLMFQIIFIGKHTINFARPSDYEIAAGHKKSVSKIPHPNHGSLGSGHTGYSWAVGKSTTTLTDALIIPKIEIQNSWTQAVDECGTSRIECGIHWWLDHQASIDAVEHFHEMIIGNVL